MERRGKEEIYTCKRREKERKGVKKEEGGREGERGGETKKDRGGGEKMLLRVVAIY